VADRESSLFTVGRLARSCGLSRSTLLYYDTIGLLRPSGRSVSNYRTYTAMDAERLKQICTYREAGLPLKDIAELLDARDDKPVGILEKHLEALGGEIARYREQQRVVVKLLQSRTRFDAVRVMDKERWVALLKATGLDESDMLRWHAEFEQMAPEAHREFLASLGIQPEEIESIRARSRGDDPV
jgi:DNA-binding transcriptional MerR regulator